MFKTSVNIKGEKHSSNPKRSVLFKEHRISFLISITISLYNEVWKFQFT